ncbi:MAG: sirohydrochlorin cobaltochelatase [Myxococcales bacterium]|nr:sirohydrochlorin cobaltochelatase [Myxococcales bacterium]
MLPSSVAIVLVDHGSKREAANAMLARVAERVTARVPGSIVEIAHMELCPPTIEQALERCRARGATRVVVHPYMLAPGRHASEDIPRMVREAADKLGIEAQVSAPLGVDDRLAELVLARCAEALDEG